jgi:hypothetical protein
MKDFGKLQTLVLCRTKRKTGENIKEQKRSHDPEGKNGKQERKIREFQNSDVFHSYAGTPNSFNLYVGL